MKERDPAAWRDVIGKRLPQVGLLVILLCLMGYLAAKEPRFLSAGTAASIFKYYSPMAMLALGMTFIILTGGIDLSVGFVMMLLIFVMAGLWRDHPGMSPALAMGAGLGTALLVGAINGLAVAYARIPAFIVTLAMMVAAYGATLVISKNQSITGLPEPLLWLGGASVPFPGEPMPLMAVVVVLTYAAAALLLNRTPYGRHLYAVGSNRESARLSGVNVRRTELAAYLLSAVCVWIAALMQLGINRTADPKIALSDNLELNAIAVVVIGGTSLAGGRGTVLGTAMGWLLLALVFYGLPLIGINEPSYKKMIQAGIIMLGAVLDSVQRRYAREG